MKQGVSGVDVREKSKYVPGEWTKMSGVFVMGSGFA